MSHFATLVLVDSPVDAEAKVEELLHPYSEEGEWFKKGSKWDWWVIGGRFSSMLDKNYEPSEDPDNFEVCKLCNGTGTRPGGKDQFGEDWFKWCNGCNGCMGKGKSLKCASEWKEYTGNIKPVSEIKEWKYSPHAIVTPDGEWYEHGEMGWFGCEDQKASDGDWLATVKDIMDKHKNCTAVVVDCHI